MISWPPIFLWNLKIFNFWRVAKEATYTNFWRRNSHTIWGLFRVYLRSIWGLFNAQIWAKEISCQTWLTARRFRSSFNLNKTAARFALKHFYLNGVFLFLIMESNWKDLGTFPQISPNIGGWFWIGLWIRSFTQVFLSVG